MIFSLSKSPTPGRDCHSKAPASGGYDLLLRLFLVHDGRLGIITEIVPAKQPDSLGIAFVHIFYGGGTVQILVDASGRFPGDYLQFPQLLQIHFFTVYQSTLDAQQG